MRRSGRSCGLSLANDVDVLGNMLDRLSEQNRWFRDFTLERWPAPCARRLPVSLFIALISRRVNLSAKKIEQVIERAMAAAKRRNPAIEESVFNFLRDILLFRFPENLDEERTRRAHAFCSEIPAMHRADHGQGTGGHGVLHLQSAGRAE